VADPFPLLMAHFNGVDSHPVCDVALCVCVCVCVCALCVCVCVCSVCTVCTHTHTHVYHIYTYTYTYILENPRVEGQDMDQYTKKHRHGQVPQEMKALRRGSWEGGRKGGRERGRERERGIAVGISPSKLLSLSHTLFPPTPPPPRIRDPFTRELANCFSPFNGVCVRERGVY
jgi:hypothetical protein